jgi:hypothetical protein
MPLVVMLGRVEGCPLNPGERGGFCEAEAARLVRIGAARYVVQEVSVSTPEAKMPVVTRAAVPAAPAPPVSSRRITGAMIDEAGGVLDPVSRRKLR